MTPARPATPVEALADDYLERLSALDRCSAARMAIGGPSDELTDYSRQGEEARGELHLRTGRDLDAVDDGSTTARMLREWVDARVAASAAGDDQYLVRIIGGPVEGIRSTFDNMARVTTGDWELIVSRLGKVPAAIASARSGIECARAAGRIEPRRQVLAVAEQCDIFGGSGNGSGWFATLAEECRHTVCTGPLPDAADRAALDAAVAYRDLGTWLRADYAPVAADSDGVGPERYARAARIVLGAELDSAEAYAWGWQELHRLDAEIAALCEAIVPGAPLVTVKATLDQSTAIEGADAWRGWLQDLIDATIDRLQGTAFDIAPPLRRCEAMLPPPGVAAAPYYTPPAEDFSYPGRTWFPTVGRTRFPTWDVATTVFHEAVPGHHLQLGWVRVLNDRLCRFRRIAGVDAHGEGWALYAERLMDELGMLEDPGQRLGFLAFQALRAARVVVDMGLHLGLRIPADDPFHPGERWTPEVAIAFLVERAGLSAAFAASEVDRYLGWPGQAISYKLGEREWLAAREEATRRDRPAFDLKAWHAQALDLGSLGLAQLREELRRLSPA